MIEIIKIQQKKGTLLSIYNFNLSLFTRILKIFYRFILNFSILNHIKLIIIVFC